MMRLRKKNKIGNEIEPGRRTKRVPFRQAPVGDIGTSLFDYITPGMIGVILIVITIALINIQILFTNLFTNIALNGLIVGLIFYAIFQAIANNYTLYNTSKYLRKLDEVVALEHITEEDTNRLRALLLTEGALVDTINMRKAIDNIDEYGILNFTHDDARLIKHKLGFRVRLNRGGVGFLAGILVMLGLLGTFWGLLKTIDSVGEAMASISNVGDGAEAMSGFIGSISAPLQGMGLAFSSSLFGLSGSLLIGFFNHLCGASQNYFIEAVGRWIDYRIPEFDVRAAAEKMAAKGEALAPAEEKEKGKAEEAARSDAPAATSPAGPKLGKDDFLGMLAGVAYLANKTNKHLVKLLPKLELAAESTLQSVQHTERLYDQQNYIRAALSQTDLTLQGIAEYDAAIASNTQKIYDQQHGMETALTRASEILEGIAQRETGIANYIQESLPEAVSSLKALERTMPPLTENVFQTLSETLSEQKSLNLTLGNYQVNFSESMGALETHLSAINKNNDTLVNEANTFAKQADKNWIVQKDIQEEMKANLKYIVDTALNTNETLSANTEMMQTFSQKYSDERKHVAINIGQLTTAINQMHANQSALTAEISRLCDVLSQQAGDVRAVKILSQLEDITDRLQKSPAAKQKKERFSLFKKKKEEGAGDMETKGGQE